MRSNGVAFKRKYIRDVRQYPWRQVSAHNFTYLDLQDEEREFVEVEQVATLLVSVYGETLRVVARGCGVQMCGTRCGLRRVWRAWFSRPPTYFYLQASSPYGG